MDHAMLLEERNLKLSWDCHPSEYLDHYLVSGVEDPRINGQSILTRALLTDALYPGRFDALLTEELRFGAVLTWILQQLEKGSSRPVERVFPSSSWGPMHGCRMRPARFPTTSAPR